MQLIVDSVIRGPAGVPEKILDRLRKDLSFANPDYINRVRFDLWVGSTPEKICLLDDEPGGGFSVPRGAVKILKHHIEDITWKDERVSFPTVGEIPFKLTTRDYQAEAIQKLIKAVQGHATVPCGGGKTILALGAVATLGQPAIILVHTKDLMEQWQDEIRTCFENAQVGTIGDGKRDIMPMTVATIQTLSGMKPDDIMDIGKLFGICIIDEAHHTPADTFRKVLGGMPAKYRFGLTATPKREDGLTMMMDMSIGNQVYEVSHGYLIDNSYLLMPRVIPLRTGISPGGDDYAKMIRGLADSQERNQKIAKLVSSENGHSVLVISGRVEHCKNIGAVLQLAGIDAEVMHGKSGKKHRRDVLDRFRNRKLNVLVSIDKLANEYLNVPCLERIVLATPIRASGQTIQRIGRLMRPFPGKADPVLYDLIDNHRIAKNQWVERRRAYKRTFGKKVIQEEVVM